MSKIGKFKPIPADQVTNDNKEGDKACEAARQGINAMGFDTVVILACNGEQLEDSVGTHSILVQGKGPHVAHMVHSMLSYHKSLAGYLALLYGVLETGEHQIH